MQCTSLSTSFLGSLYGPGMVWAVKGGGSLLAPSSSPEMEEESRDMPLGMLGGSGTWALSVLIPL